MLGSSISTSVRDTSVGGGGSEPAFRAARRERLPVTTFEKAQFYFGVDRIAFTARNISLANLASVAMGIGYEEYELQGATRSGWERSLA